MSDRRPDGWWYTFLTGGEYERLARECRSDVELARKIGSTADSIQLARRRLKRKGVVVPSVFEVRMGIEPAIEKLNFSNREDKIDEPAHRETDTHIEDSIDVDLSDWGDEEKTNPAITAPWGVVPSLPPSEYTDVCTPAVESSRISIEDDIADRRERAETAALKAKLKHALDQLEQCRYELGVALDVNAALKDPPPIEPRERMGGKREAVAFAMASDWHVEETVDADSVNGVNEFNLDIAYRRVRRFFDGFCFLTKYHSDHFLIRDSKLWLGGDLITGYLRDEDLETNSLSPVQAVAELHGWLCQGVRQYLDEVPVERLDLDCSSGNHGRLTDKMHHRGREANSLEWLLYHMIAREFRNEPRVNVTLPKGAHNYAEIYDLVIRETHGDGTKGGSGVGGIMIPIRKAIAKWQTVRHAHVTIMGHWHQEHFLNDLHINGSLVGYGPYSLSIPAPYEPPRQSFFLVDKYRGVTMPATIWLEDTPAERRAA